MDMIWAVLMVSAIPMTAVATKGLLWLVDRKDMAKAIRW
jgi:hypothetical protein